MYNKYNLSQNKYNRKGVKMQDLKKISIEYYLEKVNVFKEKYKDLKHNIDMFIDKPFTNNQAHYRDMEEYRTILYNDKDFCKLFFKEIYNFILEDSDISQINDNLQKNSTDYYDLFGKYERYCSNPEVFTISYYKDIIEDVEKILLILNNKIYVKPLEQNDTNSESKKLLNSLTLEETALLEFLLEAKTEQACANELKKSIHTIRTQRKAIYLKLLVKNKSELIKNFAPRG